MANTHTNNPIKSTFIADTLLSRFFSGQASIQLRSIRHGCRMECFMRASLGVLHRREPPAKEQFTLTAFGLPMSVREDNFVKQRLAVSQIAIVGVRFSGWMAGSVL